MPTDKPRISFAVPEDLLSRIDAFRFDHRVKNLSQAVILLLEHGLEVLESENGSKEEEPAISDGLTEVEAEFLNVFSELTPSNQRLLLGIGAVILQEQERPAD